MKNVNSTKLRLNNIPAKATISYVVRFEFYILKIKQNGTSSNDKSMNITKVNKTRSSKECGFICDILQTNINKEDIQLITKTGSIMYNAWININLYTTHQRHGRRDSERLRQSWQIRKIYRYSDEEIFM